MSVVNIISAIGNNKSIYPLIVRDCGIEVPSKIALTYNQNLKDSKETANNAARERFIDEYGTSLVWLSGIPLMDKICNYGIRKLGYNPDISIELLDKKQGQSLEKNIEQFKKTAPEAVKDIEKVLKNKSTFKKLLTGKFILSTAIPVAIMGFALPKMNFALTAKLREKQEQAKQKQSKQKQEIAFKGLYNMSTVNKMAVTDGGLTVGRVTTARNKYERWEMAFKMTMMMFLNFVAPIWIASGLDKLSGKLFNTNVNLDPRLLNDKSFILSIKNNSLELPKEGNIIETLDKKPDSKFAELCKKYCGVKYLKNNIRDPRKFVDKERISVFQKEIEKFAAQAKNSGNVEKFAKKALAIKSANILANVGISSLLLAVALPKITFALRKKVTGSDAEPGLVS